MLINFPFLPHSEEFITEWIGRLKEKNFSEEKINKMNITTDYYVPKNLEKEITGLDDNTGLFNLGMKRAIYHGNLEKGFKIISYPDFIPVLVTEHKIDNDYEFDEWDEEYNKESAYSTQEDILINSYGFVLSFSDFMSLIGEQLKQSKRKFAVIFSESLYQEDSFNKNGRLYHPDHSSFELNVGDKMYSFNIVELLNEDEYEIPQDKLLPYMGCLIRAKDRATFYELNENCNNKEYVESVLHKLEEEKMKR